MGKARALSRDDLRLIVLSSQGALERFLVAAEPECVHRDTCGILWRVEREGCEPVQVVEVENATRDYEWNRERFYLRVPPWVRTAGEAVAWTFGRERREYDPRVQT